MHGSPGIQWLQGIPVAAGMQADCKAQAISGISMQIANLRAARAICRRGGDFLNEMADRFGIAWL
jgi:hypothetical protein